MRAERQRANIDASHTPLSAVVAFGCILNEAERLAWWGVVLGAQPKEGTEDTLAHKWRLGVPQESTTVLLQDQLLTGYWRGSGCMEHPGTEVDQCRVQGGVPHTKHAVYTCQEQDLPRMDLDLHPCYFLFSNKPYTTLITTPTSSGCVLTAECGATHCMSR